MSKKTSRATRNQQTAPKRINTARPLVSTESLTKSETTTQTVVMPEESAVLETPIITVTPVRTDVVARPTAVAVSKPIPRRFVNPSTTVNQAANREDEYRFIRSDLQLVLILTVLMIIVLVVLTFVIGR